MIPQPSRRGRYLTICCGKRFWGRSKWGGRGWEKYARHWREVHRRLPAPELGEAWKRRLREP